MLIQFDETKETVIPHFYGGEKETSVRMFADESNRFMCGSLEPGASIGLHTHEAGSEIIYVLSGSGKALFDSEEEKLFPGSCHYCPKGHCHSLINDGTETLKFFAAVP